MARSTRRDQGEPATLDSRARQITAGQSCRVVGVCLFWLGCLGCWCVGVGLFFVGGWVVGVFVVVYGCAVGGGGRVLLVLAIWEVSNGGVRSTETGSGRFTSRIDSGPRFADRNTQLMATVQEYEAPTLKVVGSLSELTLDDASDSDGGSTVP